MGFGVDVLRKQRQLFLENLEPTHISHILLEEEAFSVDDHDAVNSEKRRRKKVEVLLDILEKDGSELTLESFFFALRDYQFMIEKIEEFRQAGAEVHSKIDSFPTSILHNLLYPTVFQECSYKVIIRAPLCGHAVVISLSVHLSSVLPSICPFKISCPEYVFFSFGPIWLILRPQSAFGYRVCSDFELFLGRSLRS